MSRISISVIVPIYNVEPYLRECLDSLKRQTIADFEVIMVNDGSTDGSENVAQKYEEENEHFRLINRENGGLSAARNTGIEVASGKYVLFLDSDDYLVDDALKILFYRAEADNLDVLQFTAYTIIDGNDELSWDLKFKGDYHEIYTGKEILRRFLDNNDALNTSCCLLLSRLDVIREHNLLFYEGIIHEDNIFHFQLISQCDRVTVYNKPLYCRRIRPGSITQTIDYYKTLHAMVVCAKEIDSFYRLHTDIDYRVVSILIENSVIVMQKTWYEMNHELRKNPQIKRYFKAIKPVVRKYKYFNSKTLFLFTENKFLSNIYRSISSYKKQ